VSGPVLDHDAPEVVVVVVLVVAEGGDVVLSESPPEFVLLDVLELVVVPVEVVLLCLAPGSVAATAKVPPTPATPTAVVSPVSRARPRCRPMCAVCRGMLVLLSSEG
jgi:hypothetical protein